MSLSGDWGGPLITGFVQQSRYNVANREVKKYDEPTKSNKQFYEIPECLDN